MSLNHYRDPNFTVIRATKWALEKMAAVVVVELLSVHDLPSNRVHSLNRDPYVAHTPHLLSAPSQQVPAANEVLDE